MRTGPFWDFVEGSAEPPPIAALLGFELVAVDPDVGTIEVAFTATEQFRNPVGHVQGGIVCSMLDDTLGPRLVATLGPDQWAPTLDLHTHFLAPARVGRLVGRARVVKQGRSVAFLAGELVQDDVVVATATATALIRGGGPDQAG
jgi:uncharacterized protein (TIGR00369 family)